jgi:hypothetical protein
MKLRNLSEFSELEDSVVTSGSIPMPTLGRRGKTVRKVAKVLLVGLGAAAISLAWSIPTCQASNEVFWVPIDSSVINSNVEPERAPLERLFQKRFDSGWTAEEEAAALGKIREFGEEPSSDLHAAERQEQTIDTLYYNQHEDLSSPGPGLSREEIARAIQRKKRR